MIRIITDSTCEAPPESLRHPSVSVVPLTVVFGQEALRDGIEITRDQFWARLPASNPLPTTSQAAPSDFAVLFQQYAEAGDEVIALVLSGKLSGTLSSAIIAADSNAAWPVSVVDSKSISVGLGLLLQEALRLVDAGASRSEIVKHLEHVRERVMIIFVLETLEYLQRGGRIGKAQAFMGTLLSFKPLLGIVEGEVVPLARVRSRQKALETARDLMVKQAPEHGPQVKLAVTHALAAEEACNLGEQVRADLNAGGLFMTDLGPVIGVHVGPGTVGIGMYAGD